MASSATPPPSSPTPPPSSPSPSSSSSGTAQPVPTLNLGQLRDMLEGIRDQVEDKWSSIGRIAETRFVEWKKLFNAWLIWLNKHNDLLLMTISQSLFILRINRCWST
ncbi:hypothetical protein SCP_1701220 [Sparassis crispa]|uniref:Uncharacterized protein n=1 Tax=Sparassis crispa TaxID=139825 RepID=A0A401H5S9_9APHY|nr:hypothetical protein SCP_1701220 [Sparassis crispa]GBE89797.1 hypothetical protein SCP_1701220 [Sparassis crispa]